MARRKHKYRTQSWRARMRAVRTVRHRIKMDRRACEVAHLPAGPARAPARGAEGEGEGPARRSARLRSQPPHPQQQQQPGAAWLLDPQQMDQYEADNFKVEVFEGMGRGVVTRRPLTAGQFVLVYRGELISSGEALKRERQLSNTAGSYMFFFYYKGKRLCVDATSETANFGVARLVNHSVIEPNLVPKVIDHQDTKIPMLSLYAKVNIPAGQQLKYSYGDTRKSVIAENSWLMSS